MVSHLGGKTDRLTVDEGWHKIALDFLRQLLQLLGECKVPQQHSAQHLNPCATGY